MEASNKRSLPDFFPRVYFPGVVPTLYFHESGLPEIGVRMSHFDIVEWADMVRGLVKGAKRAEMSAHLASGCQSCRQTMEILGEVSRISARESRFEVPPYVVQSARAIFALQQPEKVYFFPKIVGKLIYDSFKEPLPAGVRARHLITRHALYRAGDYSVDIRLEHQKGTATVTLVGQIVNRMRPDQPVSIVPVYLVSGRQFVAQGICNAFGEFQLEYRPRRHMRLYLQGSQELKKRIELPLSRFTLRETPRLKEPRRTAKKNK